MSDRVKGLIGVKENKVNADDYINTVRITRETKEKIYKIIEEME